MQHEISGFDLSHCIDLVFLVMSEHGFTGSGWAKEKYMDIKKLERKINNKMGLALQNLQTAGIDIEKFIVEAVHEKLDNEYHDHMSRAVAV